jgi:hypothetical protein
MSEVGIISKQYEQLVSTIDEVNAAVISLKKIFLIESNPEKYNYLRIEEPERKAAMATLAQFVTYLINLFDKRDERDYPFIPEKVLDKFRGSFEAEADLTAQFRAIDKSLRSDKLPSKERFELLDRVVTTLDMERNKLFKKLRSARG